MKMKTLNFKIEKHTKHDNDIESLALTFFHSTSQNRFADMKLFAAIYCPDILIGKGGHHIWFKDVNDLSIRLAIIYLD
jgi:hypothetical protein